MQFVNMNFRIIAKSLGHIVLAIGALFLPSILLAVLYREYGVIPGLLSAMFIALSCGALLWLSGRQAPKQFYQREALATVAFTWVAVGLLGALPFWCTGVLDYIPSVFESVSGFTTTGASVLDNVEAVPKSILFWRSFTHWLGGIGIVVLFMAVLPYLGTGGKLLFKVESSGPDPRGIRPRVRDNALILFKIYVALTVLWTVAYLLTGKMDLFDAVCHTFGALATGGYSTRQASIAAYNSAAVEAVTILAMISGATSFGLYFLFLQRKWCVFLKDTEWRAMVLVLACVSVLVAFNVAGYFGAKPIATDPGTPTITNTPSLAHSLRAATFTTCSLMTNTGYVTDDYDGWPFFSRMLLVTIMFVGGSAGSTAGGIKMIRVVMVFKMLGQRIGAAFRPHTVRALRIGSQVIREEIQKNVLLFALAYLICFAVCSLVMSVFGLPFQSAISAVAACMSNTGPGLELVGGAETYSIVPSPGLAFLCFVMILGRLELFTLLAVLAPTFWRRP